MTPIDRHQKVALQFSGGKDSLACLYLLKPFWDRITVVWLNTGAAYPEVIAQMDDIKRLVPNFLEVVSDQPSFIAKHGTPADFATENVNHWSRCCSHNIWEPLHKAMIDGGYTLIIRGQKDADVRRAPVTTGFVDDNGIEYWLPLEHWSHEDVLHYLNSIEVPVPNYYEWSDTSLDCWNCTAFLDEREKEVGNLVWKHPEMWVNVRDNLIYIEEELESHAQRITTILRGDHVEKN